MHRHVEEVMTATQNRESVQQPRRCGAFVPRPKRSNSNVLQGDQCSLCVAHGRVMASICHVCLLGHLQQHILQQCRVADPGATCAPLRWEGKVNTSMAAGTHLNTQVRKSSILSRTCDNQEEGTKEDLPKTIRRQHPSN